MLPAKRPTDRRPSTAKGGGVRPLLAITAGLALFLVIVGLITNGLSGGLIMAATFAFLTGLYTLLTNRPSWARLGGRRAGAITAGIAVVVMLAGGAMAPDSAPTALAEQTTGAAEATTSPSPSATASATPSVTPNGESTTEPSASATASDVAPLDADAVVGATGEPGAPSAQPAANTTALALLETLPIKGRAPQTGYSREQFGEAWLDVDRNGCDTRNDMLNRDLTDIEHIDSGSCKVQQGTLADPYTGTTIAFQRGTSTSSDVQIDHVVALSDAWQKGAQQLTFDQRVALANDPLNLQSADGPTNQQKGDGDAATWLPPNTGYRCEYVARQVSVKATYALWVTQAEHDAMARVLSDCNGILAPTNQVAPSVAAPTEQAEQAEPPAPAPVVPEAPVPAPAPVVPEPVVPEPVAPPVVVPEVPAPAAPAPGAFYANCSEVRAAGAAPIHSGDPGFQSKFDGNGDGVGCE